MGSNPPLENGLHLKILQIAFTVPFTTPNLFIALIEYSEQDG